MSCSRSFLGVPAVLLVLGCATAAEPAGGGGSEGDGGAGAGTTSSAASTADVTTGVTTGATTGATTSSSSGAGGYGPCTEITVPAIQRVYSSTYCSGFCDDYYSGELDAFEGLDPDYLTLEFYGAALSSTGEQDLAAGLNTNYATCETCVLVFQDVDDFGDQAKTFFQVEGTVDLGDGTYDYPDGQLLDVTLVEVTLAGSPSFTSTPVPGGECIHLVSEPLVFVAPSGDWTCDPLASGDGLSCDCACGADDPDCVDAALPVIGCEEGQTCVDQACSGTPTAWTDAQCDPADYDADDECHCECGVLDPDCETSSTVIGCDVGEICSDEATCMPDGWTCDPGYYGDGSFCDCECGAWDVDCDDPDLAADPFGCDTGDVCDPTTFLCVTPG